MSYQTSATNSLEKNIPTYIYAYPLWFLQLCHDVWLLQYILLPSSPNMKNFSISCHFIQFSFHTLFITRKYFFPLNVSKVDFAPILMKSPYFSHCKELFSCQTVSCSSEIQTYNLKVGNSFSTSGSLYTCWARVDFTNPLTPTIVRNIKYSSTLGHK